MSARPTTPVRETYERANAPGLYVCPHCGETLSGPPELYAPCWCAIPVESLGMDE
jgi:hypothetical protein